MAEERDEQIQIKEFKSAFLNDRGNINKTLQLADSFIEAHPNIIFWTDKNDFNSGLFYIYKNGCYKPTSSFEVENMLYKFKPEQDAIDIPATLNRAKICETMLHIKRNRFFYRDDFNPDGIINFKNCYLDIYRNKVIEHTPRIISTNQLPYDFDPGAKCPNFLNALEFSTERDKKKQDLIQEFAGYCLSRETNIESVLFIIGVAGSGKSTILDGIEAMLGKANVSSVSLDQLVQPRYAGMFIDKMANIDREISKDTVSFEAVFNRIVSGEPITVDTKFIASYTARPFCKLIFAANDMPTITDTSDAVFRRMLLIYFNNPVPPHLKDVDLKKKVAQEGAGIFNWAYKGYERLMKNKRFTRHICMDLDIDMLKRQNNAIYSFMYEEYEVTGNFDDYVCFDDIYDTYKHYILDNGGKGVYKKVIFSKELRKVFNKKISDKNVWIPELSKAKKVILGVKKKDKNPINWNE